MTHLIRHPLACGRHNVWEKLLQFLRVLVFPVLLLSTLSFVEATSADDLRCESGRVLLVHDPLPPTIAAAAYSCCPSMAQRVVLLFNASVSTVPGVTDSICVMSGSCIGSGTFLCGDTLSCCNSGWTCGNSLDNTTGNLNTFCTFGTYRNPRGSFELIQGVQPTTPKNVSQQCTTEQSPCRHNSTCTPGYDRAICTCAGPAFVQPNCTFICPGGQRCEEAPAIDSAEYNSTICPEGYFCASSGYVPSPPPTLCPLGYFCPNGSAAATPCEPGSLCLVEGRGQPQPCPSGRFCAGGATPATIPFWMCPPSIMMRDASDWLAGRAPRCCAPGDYSYGSRCYNGPCVTMYNTLNNGGWFKCPPAKYSSYDGACCPTGSTCDDSYNSVCWQNNVGQNSGSLNYPYAIDQKNTTPAVDLSARCTPSPCLHGTTCTPTWANYTCDCPFGFLPPQCDFSCPSGSLCANAPAENSTAFDSVLCPEGNFCPSSTIIPTPAPQSCPRGYFCPLGSGTPVPCGVGFYCDQDGMSEPTKCPVGLSCNSTISTQPSGLCPAGFFCALGVAPQVCEVNRYCPTTGLGGSLPCPLGKICAVGTITPITPIWACPLHSGPMTSTDPQYVNALTPPKCCSIGYVSSGSECGNWACGYSSYVHCGTGSGCCASGETCYESEYMCGYMGYNGGYKYGFTDLWTFHKYNALTLALEVHSNCELDPCFHTATCSPTYEGVICACPRDPAFYSDNRCRFTCPAGRQCHTAPATNSSDYIWSDCPATKYCPFNSSVPTQPIPCPAGFYCPIRTIEPIRCELGRYCPPESSESLLCPAGTYGASTGLSTSNCSGVCPDGSICYAGSTSASMSQCPAGNVCPRGSVTPIICPAGYTCGSSLSSLSQAVACVATGSTCPAGSFNVSGCSPGYFCSNPAAIPVPCTTQGTYCPSWSTTPQPCPAGLACPLNLITNPGGSESIEVYGTTSVCDGGTESQEGWGVCVMKCAALHMRDADRPDAPCVWGGGAIAIFVASALVSVALVASLIVNRIRHRRNVRNMPKANVSEVHEVPVNVQAEPDQQRDHRLPSTTYASQLDGIISIVAAHPQADGEGVSNSNQFMAEGTAYTSVRPPVAAAVALSIPSPANTGANTLVPYPCRPHPDLSPHQLADPVTVRVHMPAGSPTASGPYPPLPYVPSSSPSSAVRLSPIAFASPSNLQPVYSIGEENVSIAHIECTPAAMFDSSSDAAWTAPPESGGSAYPRTQDDDEEKVLPPPYQE